MKSFRREKTHKEFAIKAKNMQRILIKNNNLEGSKFIRKEYQPALLSYQETKTEWGKKKRKVSWNLIPKNLKNNKP